MRHVTVVISTFLAVVSPVLAADPPADDTTARQLEELKKRLESQDATLSAQQAQIQAQAKEIEELRTQVPSDWLTEQRAAEIKGLVADVLADADTRASLLQSGVMAGHDGKAFFIGSGDGNFLLKVGGQVQPRYIYNHRDNPPPVALGVPGDENEYGFQIRRVKLWFDGHVFSPKLTYKLQLAANRDTGAVDLEIGPIGYMLNDELQLFVGRFVDPLLRDQFTSNTRQLAVERSITSYIFAANDNYAEGVGADWRPGDAWRLRGTINDGIGSGNPGGTGNDFFADNNDIGVTGRVDWKIAGEWKQMDDCQAWSGEPTGAFLGAGIHYEQTETGDSQTSAPFDSQLVYTLDGSFETGGFNIYGAVIGQNLDLPAGGTDLDNFGILVQAGYMIVPDKWEPFARYEFVSIDNAPADVQVFEAGIIS